MRLEPTGLAGSPGNTARRPGNVHIAAGRGQLVGESTIPVEGVTAMLEVLLVT